MEYAESHFRDLDDLIMPATVRFWDAVQPPGDRFSAPHPVPWCRYALVYGVLVPLELLRKFIRSIQFVMFSCRSLLDHLFITYFMNFHFKSK